MAHFITVTRAAQHVILTTLIAAMLTLNGIACSHQAAVATQGKGSDQVEKTDPEPSQVSNQKTNQNGIDAATIAAYEKLGATYRVEGLPYFKFKVFPKVKLPDVAVPFGLDLSGSDVTDLELKELARLKYLQKLHIDETQVTNTGLKDLAGLKSLQTLGLSVTKVTDAGLKELSGLESLQTLGLARTQVTDAGLKELGGLKKLQEIFLNGTQVTDAGLKELARITSLKRVWLDGTQVTDTGLKELVGLKNLTTLDLRDTRVTEAGVVELRKVLPQVQIDMARPTASISQKPAKQNELMHEGKTISQWAALLNNKNVKEYQRAVDALSHLAAQSNDAIPELVKALYVSDHVNDFERIVIPALVRVGKPIVPALRDELKQINTVITKPPQGVDPKKSGTLVITQVHRYTAIMHALRRLGTEADEAADEVRRFYEKSKTTSTRNVARDTLHAIQPTAATYIRRGTEAYTKGEYEKAIDLLSKAINMDKSNPTAKNQKQQKSRTFHIRAAVYAKLEKHDLAIADLNEAIRLDPTKASLYQHRAKVYDDKGDKKLADADRNEAARLQDKTAKAPLLPSFRMPMPVAPTTKQETTISRIDYARKIAPQVVNNTSRTDFLKQYPNAKIAPAHAEANYFAYEVVENQATVFYLFHGEKILAARRINNAGAILKQHDLSFKLLKEMEKKFGNPDDTEVTEEQIDAGVFMCSVWFIPDQQIMIMGLLVEMDVRLAPSLVTEVVHYKNVESVKK